jgi:hypothetical protein
VKVYIVIDGNAEDEIITDVYASKEEAEADAKKHNDALPPRKEWTWKTSRCRVEEHEVK